MKAYKFLCGLILAATALCAVSCKDDEVPSPYTEVEQKGAYLFSEASSYQFTPADAQVLTVSIGRSDSIEAHTYALTGDNTKFQVPASVSFAAGEKTKNISIPFTIETGATETLTLKLDSLDTYTYGNQYIEITVKVDYTWQDLGKGTIISELFGESFEVNIKKAAEANVYVLPDAYYPGYPLQFELSEDGEELIQWGPDDMPQYMGYVDDDYGPMAFYPAVNEDDTYAFAREDNTLSFIIAGYVIYNGNWARFTNYATESVVLPEE